MRNVKKIQKIMIQSLEEVDDKGVCRGDYICHQDIPKECPEHFDEYFCVVGDNPDKSWLV